MRMKVVSLTVICLVAALPAMADIGTVSMSLHVGEDNGPNDLNPAVGIMEYVDCASVPLALTTLVDFSATTTGPDGPNVGVFGIYADLYSAPQLLCDQSANVATLDTYFGWPLGFYTPFPPPGSWGGPYGLGFDAVVSAGTGDTCGIYGFGASQTSTPGTEHFGYYDAQYAGHPMAPHVAKPMASGLPLAANDMYTRAVGDVVLATATLTTCCPGPGTYYLVVDATANLWGGAGSNPSAVFPLGGNVYDAAVNPAMIEIIVLPEPSTLILLAPALLALRRRRA